MALRNLERKRVAGLFHRVRPRARHGHPDRALARWRTGSLPALDPMGRGRSAKCHGEPHRTGTASARADNPDLPRRMLAEPFRSVPARLRFEHHSRRLRVTGLPATLI